MTIYFRFFNPIANSPSSSVRLQASDLVHWSEAQSPKPKAFLRQLTDPARLRVAVPQHALAVDVEPVRGRILFRELNLRHDAAVLGIQLVDGTLVRVDAPHQPLVPREPVRALRRAGPGNAADDLPGLRLHQENLARGGNRHPVF